MNQRDFTCLIFNIKKFMRNLLLSICCIPLFALPASGQSGETPLQSVLQPMEVYFDFGKYELRPVADSALLDIARRFREDEQVTVRITAHTDSIGSLKNNENLSRQRADAVKSFLVGQGIPADAISVETFGETRPAAANATGEGRQLNRRATIEVLRATPLATLEGTVIDEKTGKPLIAYVVIRTSESRDSLRTDSTGYFKKTLPPGTVAGVDAFAECYFMKSKMLKVSPGAEPLTLPLRPVQTGEKMDIENLYYVGNQPVLLEKSRPELPKILRFMQLNPQMKIEIAGHVNYPNRPAVIEESFEYKLSVDRAKMVYEYLLENGIAADRISYKGYGNWEMRYPNATSEEQQALNRRVEIRILEGGCP